MSYSTMSFLVTRYFPLTSISNMAFPPTELLLTECFWLFTPLVIKFYRLTCVKFPVPRSSAVSKLLNPADLAPTTIPPSTESTFFPILMFAWEAKAEVEALDLYPHGF